MQVPVVCQLLLQVLPGIHMLQSHQQPMTKCKLRVDKWKMKVFCVSFANRTWTAKMAEHLKHPLVDILSAPIAWESGAEWPRLGIFTSAHCIPQSTPEPAQQAAAGDDNDLEPLDSGSDWWRRCSSSCGGCSHLGPWAFVKALWESICQFGLAPCHSCHP